jgi:hypothetical protein
MYMPLFEENVEIWVRNADDGDGYTKMKAVYDFLQRKGNFITDNSYVYFVHSLTDIEDAGIDTNLRKLYKATFRVIFREQIS